MMTNSRIATIALTALASSTGFAAGGLTFDMGHTVQNCHHDGHQPTWCDGNAPSTDVKDSTAASGLEAKILAQLDRALAHPDTSKVLAAEFSFSNKHIQQKVCAVGKAGIPTLVVLDYGSSSNLDFITSDCQKDPNHPNLVGKVLGGFTNFPEWRLHHNKTVVVDTGDGSPVDVDFSSGNLSTFGTSLHMDHWVFVKAPADSNLVKAELCLFDGLKAAIAKAKDTGMYAGAPDFTKDPEVTGAYKQTRDACFQQKGVLRMSDYETAISREGIAPFFTPNNGHEALNALKDQIKAVTRKAQAGQQGTYIYIAIEHFLNGSLGALINQAANAGVDVAIIFNSSTVTGTSEVQGDKEFMEQNLKPNPRIKLRFIETNPNAGGNGQQMHNKFAILNGKRVFSGAGHYTSSGLDTNWETLYLTQSPELTKKYAEYFQQLWNISVDDEYLENNTGSIKPAPKLVKAFTDLVSAQ